MVTRYDLINDKLFQFGHFLCKTLKIKKVLNVLINITKFIPRQDLNPPSPLRHFTICGVLCVQRLNRSYMFYSSRIQRLLKIW